jgi:hypothetical protein
LLERSKLRSQAPELALRCVASELALRCFAATQQAPELALRCFAATQQAPELALLAVMQQLQQAPELGSGACLLAAATQQAPERESLLLQHSKLQSLLQLNPATQQALERLLQ